MHFLVYLPGEHAQPTQRLAEVGLGHLVDSAGCTSPIVGPDGQPGTMFRWCDTVPLAYRPKVQTWIPANQMGHLEPDRYYVGIWKEHPPTPKELLRTAPVRGKAITFGDGQEWTVPKAMEIPFTMKRGRDGQWRFHHLKRYESFLLSVDIWRDRVEAADEGDTFSFIDIADFIEEALNVNYRLTPEVVSHLEMFQSGDGENLLRALLAIVRTEVVDA